jgi:hypothetical protein
MSSRKIRRLAVVDKNNKNHKIIGLLTRKDLFNAIDKNPPLFSELYGNDYPMRIKEITKNSISIDSKNL